MNDLMGMVKTPSARNGSSNRDIEAPAPPPEPVSSPSDPAMDAFFKEVATIKGMMMEIRNYENNLEEANDKSKTVTRSEDMHALREQMQRDAHDVCRIADQIKKRLGDLEKSNAASLKKKGCGKGSSTERTRTAVTAALKKKLKEQMGEFQELRARLQREYRDTVERRVYTVTGKHASEDEIDRMIETGEGETVFQQAMVEQGRGQVMDTLAEIRERRDAVVELEKSLTELHQIFLDMAVLVEAQGEMIDNIEAQVARSAEYVDAGTKHLTAAKTMQKKTRKWLCCALILGIIIIVAVVIAALGVTGAF